MPTSSQALILLSVDGQLPSHITEKKQSITSVPYPVRCYDINNLCIDPNEETTPRGGFGRRGTRVDFESLVETLPDLLSIKGYQGNLSFDPTTQLLHWKVNVDDPPRRKNSLVTQKQGVDYDYERDQHDRHFRLPSLFENEREKSDSLSTGVISERDLFYADSLYHVDNGQIEESNVFEQKPKKRFSLPIFLKSTENENLHTRLYSLGFRRPSYATPRSNRNDKPARQNNETNEQHSIPKAWEYTDKYSEETFKPNDPHTCVGDSEYGQYPHGGQRKYSNLEEYLADRNKFFDKYGNYTPEGPNKELPGGGQNRPIRIPGASSNDLQAALMEIGSLNSRRQPQQDFPQQEAIEDQKSPEKVSLMEDVSLRSNYNKWKKQKLTTVRLRKEAPAPQPLAVCFSLHDNAICHGEIKDLIEEQLGCPVVSLQFDPISVHALANDTKSRWIATLRKKDHVDLLKLNGLVVNGETITVRSLDDAMKDEVEAYKLFQMVKNGQIRLSGYGDAKNKRKKSRNGFNLLDFVSKEEIPAQ